MLAILATCLGQEILAIKSGFRELKPAIALGQ